MITLDQYWMGRDTQYHEEWTSQIQYDGAETVRRVNLVLDKVLTDTHLDFSIVASGWRPVCVNDRCSNAGIHSNHINALACDIRDTGNRDLARWCVKNTDFLEEVGLWMESPQWCPTWVHLQSVPPGSHKRIYIPSMHPPLCPPLEEQLA